MAFVLALIAGLVGAALGWAAAAAATLLLAGRLGVSDFEGQRAMVAIFGIGPIGGLVGLVAGAALGLRWHRRHTAGGIAWRLPLVLLSIVGAAAAAIWWLYETRPVLNSGGPPPRLVFEVRLPHGFAPPGRDTVKVELHAEKNRMSGSLVEEPARGEDGRAVLAGEVSVDYRSSWRLLEVKVPGQADRLFQLGLPASPRRTTGFGGWERAQFIAEPGGGQPRKAGADEGFEIRYRIVWPE
jgi:MFS family permease